MTNPYLLLVSGLCALALTTPSRAEALQPGERSIPIALSDSVLVLIEPVSADGVQGHGQIRLCTLDAGTAGRLGTSPGSAFSACRTVASVRRGETALLVDTDGALSPDQRFLRYSRARPGAMPAQEVLALDTGAVTPFVLPGSSAAVSASSAGWAPGYPHALEVRSGQGVALAWPPVTAREMMVDASPEARAELARAVQLSAAEAARGSVSAAAPSSYPLATANRLASPAQAQRPQVVVVDRPVPVPVRVPVHVHSHVHRPVAVVAPPAPEPPPVKVVPPAYQGPLRPLPDKPGCRTPLPGVPHKALTGCQ